MSQHATNATLLNQAADYAYDYLTTVDERPVFPMRDALADLAKFDEPIPDAPCDPAAVLRRLHKHGSPATVAQGGGRYFGFVNGGVLPVALAARWLADAWDQNAGLFVMSPIASKLEQVCERWLVDLLGLPAGTVAGFVSGTSTATMCGMAAGRNALLARQGWDVAEQGLFGAPPIKVVTSEAAHGTVWKGLGVLGIGRSQTLRIPADAQGRLDPAFLPNLDANTLVVLQAGNVNSGAFDPFGEVCERARAAGAWVHVDGAFGLWAAACSETRHLTSGIARADSWSVDGHKTLNTPYDSGVVLCADRHALAGAMTADGAYIQFSDQRDGMRFTPEMSRRARGVEMWALLKSLGRSGVDSLIARLCANARLFADELRGHDFRVLNDVVFNQVVIACENESETERTLTQIQRDGVCWVGGSRWQNEGVIRVSVCSWRTTEEDVRRSARAFADARETVRGV